MPSLSGMAITCTMGKCKNVITYTVGNLKINESSDTVVFVTAYKHKLWSHEGCSVCLWLDLMIVAISAVPFTT